MFSKRTGWKLTHNRITIAQQEMREAGIHVLDLTVSNPTRCGLPYDAETILGAFRNPAAMDYDPQPKGLLSAREAVSRYYYEAHGAAVGPESILLTTSTSEAYSYVFRLLCNPGDEVLVPKPSYPLFDFLADLQDVTLAPFSLVYGHDWLIDFQSLIRGVTSRTRAILLVHPNNPTGSFVRPEEAAILNKFCREHNLALVVDEVFLDYPHDDARRPTFASNREALTFTLSGLSKISGLPQMKVAWVVTTGPEKHVKPALARLEIVADTYLSLNEPAQLATPLLLEQRKNIQPALLERIRKNREELSRQLAKRKTCEPLDVEGGWYGVLRVPATQSDEDLAIALLRQRAVLVHPGHFYDFPSDGYLVVSLITPVREFREGIARVLEHMRGSE
jgi:alanine-synthesizing transaminase